MIREQFHRYGEIAYMEVYESKRSYNLSARVRFSPPPNEAFWETDQFIFQHLDTYSHPNGIPVNVRPDTRPPTDWVSSNIDQRRSYAGRTIVKLNAVRIGSRTKPDEVTIAESCDHKTSQPDFCLQINAYDKYLSARFQVEINTPQGSRLRSYKMRINVAQIRRAYRTTGDGGQETIVVPLEFPPEYWWKRDDVATTISNERVWCESDTWYRASYMADRVDSPLKYPVSVSCNVSEQGYVALGRWTTCQFAIAPDQAQNLALLREVLEDLNVRIENADDLKVIVKGQADMWKHLDHSSPQGSNATAMLQMWSDQVHLPFEVRYQLEACISRGKLHEHNITREFLEKLASEDPMEVQSRLELIADRARPTFDPVSYFDSLDTSEPVARRRIPEYCYLVRKAIVTPTTMYLNVPSYETSNRVIRQYSHIADRFLKVQFMDEGEAGRLRAAGGLNNDEIWKRVWRTLDKGIRIGDCVFEFLAFGNSQLRECGAYFFCPTDHISCDDIRQWAGDFNHIKVIAKYAARLGQCFSTTRVLQGIPNPDITTIPDIERNGHCFTDGVGKISKFLADFIAAEMPGNQGERPTAFQFRIGGSKGVLVVSDDVKGTEVHIRPSQEKFKAQFNGLEIVRCARPATATLNRQTITILSDLNVPDAAFITLLEHQLRQYDAATRDNAVAIELLTKFVDQNHTSLAIAELIHSGFRSDDVQEPFVLNVFSLWRSWSLKLLKEKARIHVEQSAFVIGCVDETGILRGHSIASEGIRAKDVERLPQIFLQTIDPTTGKSFVLEGVCIVGRNPSLHNGDIRVVEAIDCPQLRHLKDVVVFPSTGDRPVPSMLSGGDLDGDDFFVIWDKTLIPEIWNWRPMDFSPIKPREVERDVNSQDLRQFFVQYMMNDVLPLIAISHLAWADEQKPRSNICRRLAELHSHAVDYAKTGEPVDWDKKEMWPKRWPHFMEKDKRKTYDSVQVLGRLFDNVTKDKIAFEPDWSHAFDKRVLERYDLDDDLLDEARHIKAEYDRSVRRILAQLNLGTEFELWTGFAMSKPTIGTDYKRQEVLGQELETLKLLFRGLCEEAAGGNSPEDIDPFVAAMYKVTEEETTRALQTEYDSSDEDLDDDIDDSFDTTRRAVGPKVPLITFPWLFPEVMVRIAKGERWVPKKPWYSPSERLVKPREAAMMPSVPPHMKSGGQSMFVDRHEALK
ncbi:RdRP-domain-containing protein [Sarocladium strictum]